MGRAGASRGLGLGKLVLWIGLLLMLAVVGCSSDQDPAPAAAADAASSVDQVDLPDSAEAQKAECEAKNAGCTKAYWSNSGTCVLQANLGASCGSGPAECRGSCDADGQCVQPGPEKACGECSRCDGKGACLAALAGAACKLSVPTACTSIGVCSALGVCTASFTVGSPCPIANPLDCIEATGVCGVDGGCKTVPKTAGLPCSVLNPTQCVEKSGVCDATGYCAPITKAAGTACSVINPTGCIKAASTCDIEGNCLVVPKPIGSPCPVANPGACVQSTGTCGQFGYCAPVLKAVGSPCPIASPSSCAKSTGSCGADGGCKPVFKPVGTQCSLGYSTECTDGAGTCAADGTCKSTFKAKGTPCGAYAWTGCGFCNSTGTCLVNFGADCTVPDGSCAGQPGVCNTEGYCAASLPCGKAYFPQPCGKFALGKACKKTYASSAYPQNCSAPSAYPTANSNSCGDAGDPCQPKMCGVDANSASLCTASQLPDGAPCPGVAGNPCSAAKCLSGKCQAAAKPAGTACTPHNPKQCGAHACNAAGECAAVVPAVPLASSCTLSDGDTDCWVKSCDSAGTCTKIPRPAGEACGVVPDDACSAHRCDGKGWCVAQLTSETEYCKHSDCLLPTATFGSPCPIGPCVSSGCMKLGLCYTKYKPAGTSCEINKILGTCDADHHCNLTAKATGSVVGHLCFGQFPCMKEDVAYGEDGACHGTVATGEICGTPCKPGICGADGTCQLALAPTGTTCGATDYCGKMECDGKGECGFPKAAVGANCGSPSWPQPAECEQYTCNVKGECSTTAAVGKSCKTPSPCLVGTCTKYSKCGYEPISGPVCDLAAPDACNTGLCKVGKCEPVPKPGGACGKESACMAYQCDAAGQCGGIPKPGASCESTGTCTKGVCDSKGQCTQVVAPGAKCMGKEQCMEGVCSPSGACMLGPKAAGSQCTAVAPGTNWDCYTGVCDGKGGCTLKVNAGAKCKEGDGACTTGVCQSDASCKAIPANLGKACTNQCATNPVCGPTGKCEGAPLSGKACYDECLSSAICSAQGECVGTATVGKACGDNNGAPACRSYACSSTGKCIKTNSPPGGKCVVGAVFPGEIPSYPCGSQFGTCNGSGGCVPTSTNPDGTPCGADDGCANAHVCKGGLCLPVEPKPNGTVCKFGCATGTCGAGACMAFPSYDWNDSGPCADGSPCTNAYCIGSPLPGMGGSGLDIAPEGAGANAGKCSQVWLEGICPNGKPWDPNSCLVVGCPNKNQCGEQETCLNQFNGNHYCGTPYGSGGGPACETNNPCGTSGCWSGSCTFSPVANSTPCGAFKHCYNGECKAME